jgi:hypothetical protein
MRAAARMRSPYTTGLLPADNETGRRKALDKLAAFVGPGHDE